MFVALAALITLSKAQQPVDPFVIETFDQAVRHVFPDQSYKLELANGLEDVPVVYSFPRPTNPKSDLQNFCSALFLETEFDEATKRVKIKKSQFLFRNDRRKDVDNAIEKLREEIAPQIALGPKKVHLQKMNFVRILDSTTDEEERGRLRSKIETCDQILRTTSFALTQSLLSNPSVSGILAKPYSKSNYVPVNSHAMPYLNQYLEGNGLSPHDYYDTNDLPNRGQGIIQFGPDQVRKEGKKLGRQEPIPLIRHLSFQFKIFVWLALVLPSEEVHIADIMLPIGKIQNGTVSDLPPLATKKNLEVRQLWNTDFETINSLGTMASELQANYAGWLAPQPLMNPGGTSFETLQRFQPGLSAKLNNGWLSIYDLNSQMPTGSKAWGPFLKLRELFDAQSVSRSGLLAQLSKLTEKDLNNLEDLGGQFSSLPDRYLALTSYVRLFRAYLACIAIQTENRFEATFTYNQLPEGAQKDFIGFFTSPYVWNAYAQLFHPANQSKFKAASLKISYDPKSLGETDNTIGITFPDNWNPIRKSLPMNFRIATKNMVP